MGKYSDRLIGGGIDKPEPVEPTAPESRKYSQFLGGVVGVPGAVTKLPTRPGPVSEEAKQTFSDIARPTIAGATSALGAIAGTPEAPGVGTLIGGGLGYAVGEELADKLDEFMGLRERQPLLVELKESAEQVVTGAAYEAGGQSIFPAVAPAVKFIASKIPKIAFTGKGAAKIGAKVIAAETSSGPIFAKNIDEARALEEAIPGLKFSRGEITKDPEIIKFERGRAAAPGDVATAQVQRAAENSEAVRNFINTQKGKGGIEDVLQPMAKERAAIESGAEAAPGAVRREAQTLETGVGAVEAGQPIRKAFTAGERSARKEAGELFEQVPEFDIDASQLVTKIDELSQPMNKFEATGKNVPEEFEQIKKVLVDSDGIATPQDLQGLRSSLTDSLRDAQGAANPNNRMISRISKMIGEVDDVLKKASEAKAPKNLFTEENRITNINKDGGVWAAIKNENPDMKPEGKITVYRATVGDDIRPEDFVAANKRVAYDHLENLKDRGEVGKIVSKEVSVDDLVMGNDATEFVFSPQQATTSTDASESLKTAQQFFKKEVIDKFKSGTPGDILKKKGGQYKVTNANIASRFFKAGSKGQEAAQEFMNAIGKDKEALSTMKDYIKQDLIDKSTNPNTGEIVKTKLNSWLAKNKKALDVYGMGKEFNSIKKAQAALDDAMTMKTEFNKSVASKMLDADVDSAIGKAFQKGSTRVAAQKLMRQLKGDKKAINGLQNGIIDHIITKAETTAPDFLGNKIISLASFEKEFKKMAPAMRIVFKDSPLKIKALMKYRSALGRMQTLKKSPTLGGGSDTAEKVISNLAYQLGAGKSKVLNLLKTVAQPLLTLNDNLINAVLNRAAVDPDFAYTLQLMAKGRKPDMIERRLKGHIASLGLKIGE